MSDALELGIVVAIGSNLAEMWAGLLVDTVPQRWLEAIAEIPIESGALVEFLFVNFSPALIYTAGTVMGGVAFCAIVSLAYLVKTALGIDLFDGPSVLHYLFFD